MLPRRVRDCINYLDNILVDDFALQTKGSSILFVIFAGMSGIRKTLARARPRIGAETRPFEFVHSLQGLHCDAIFLRDRYKAYYHSGVKGLGKNVEEVADFLNGFIDQRKYDLVVTLGHSMGGYASLLFASKIKADICIAISAPTFLDPENRARFGDDRYDYEKTRLYKSKKSSRYYDLRSYFISEAPANGEKSCTYCIFYGENDRLDKIHATRMADLSHSIHVYEVKRANHNAAREMRDSGLIRTLFDSILSLKGRGDVNMLLKSIEEGASIRAALSL